MGWLTWSKIALQVLSILCLLAGMAVTFVAMFGTQWQIADFGGGYVHYHGLWKDCETNSKVPIKGSDWVCWYKFDESNARSIHPFTSWQMTTLALLGSANALALIATILACLACCIKFCSFGWVVLCFLACAASSSGLFVYYRWASASENRFEKNELNQAVEQVFGQSFYLAIGGCALYVVATLVSALCCVIIFFAAKAQHHSNKTWPKYPNTHNTVV